MLRVSPAYLNRSLTLEQINSLSVESFHYFFEGVIIAELDYFHTLWSQLPFPTERKLIDAFLTEVDNLNKYDKFVMLHKYGFIMNYYVNKFKPHSNSHTNETEDHRQYNMFIKILLSYKDKFNFPFIFNPVDRNLISVYRELDYRINNTESTEMNEALHIIKQMALRELEKRVI